MPGLNGSPASAVKISLSARRRVLLEALRVEQQLGRGVVVLLEDRVDLVEERLHRLGLGLGGRRRAAVGLGRRVAARSPRCRGPSSTRSCGSGRRRRRASIDAVVVVVAQVLAPQAVAGGERVLVAVGVVDADEPQLGGVDELRDLEAGARALAVVVDEVARACAGRSRRRATRGRAAWRCRARPGGRRCPRRSRPW